MHNELHSQKKKCRGEVMASDYPAGCSPLCKPPLFLSTCVRACARQTARHVHLLIGKGKVNFTAQAALSPPFLNVFIFQSKFCHGLLSVLKTRPQRACVRACVHSKLLCCFLGVFLPRLPRLPRGSSAFRNRSGAVTGNRCSARAI